MHSIVCVSQTRTVWSKLAETSLCSDWLLHLTNVTPDRCPANLPLVLNPFSSRSRMKILLSLEETANFSWFTGDHDISDRYFFDIASEYSSCFDLNRNQNLDISLKKNTISHGKVHTVFSSLFMRIFNVPLEKPTAMYLALTLTDEIDTGYSMNLWLSDFVEFSLNIINLLPLLAYKVHLLESASAL